MPSGKSLVTKKIVHDLLRLRGKMIQLRSTERQELVDYFYRYDLEFSGIYWIDMRIKQEHMYEAIGYRY